MPPPVPFTMLKHEETVPPFAAYIATSLLLGKRDLCFIAFVTNCHDIVIKSGVLELRAIDVSFSMFLKKQFCTRGNFNKLYINVITYNSVFARQVAI